MPDLRALVETAWAFAVNRSWISGLETYSLLVILNTSERP
jgi:hypothetical protein